jgi:hypothetical protein
LQAKAVGRRVRVRRLVSTAAAERAVRDGAIVVALVDGRRLLVKSSRSQSLVHVVQDAVAAQVVLDRLINSGLTQTQALSVLTPRALRVDVLDPNARTIERNLGCSRLG